MGTNIPVAGLIAVVAALALPSAATASGPTAVQVSADPFTNPSSQHATEVEPDSFAAGQTVVTAFQAGRFTDGGSSGIGYAVSHDAGLTWSGGFLPGLTRLSSPPGAFDRASDPAVAYDVRHGVWVIAVLALLNTTAEPRGAAVVVSRSTDGGASWSGPVTVASTSGYYDKDWVVCDNGASSPHYGNCYATWDDTFQNDLLLSSASSDGGLTWGTPKATADAARGLAAQPLVRPDGTVVVPYFDPNGPRLAAYRSTDGGATWTATTQISQITAHHVAGGLRSDPFPSAETDASGTVYLAWQDCRFRSGCPANDIVLSTSADGTTWTAPARVALDAATGTADHFIPGLGVDPATAGPTAHLGLSYYHYPNANCGASTCQLGVAFVSSADGGRSWSAPVELAAPMSLDWLAATDSGAMVGDYISTSFAGGHPVAAYSAATANDPSFHQAIYAARLDVTAPVAVATVLVAKPAVAELGPGPAVTFPNLSAVLTAAAGAPVVGRSLSFTAGGQPVCTAVTDATGEATCGGVTQALQAVLALGYQATFAGDAAFLPSTASGPLLRVLGTPLP